MNRRFDALLIILAALVEDHWPVGGAFDEVWDDLTAMMAAELSIGAPE